MARAASTPATARTVSRSLPDFIPRPRPRPGFDGIDRLSTSHRWFTFVRLPDPYLTESSSAFSRTAHHPGSHPHAASGGLRTDPATRPRGACPHLSCSKAAKFRMSLLISFSSRRHGARSNATVRQDPPAFFRRTLGCEPALWPGVGEGARPRSQRQSP